MKRIMTSIALIMTLASVHGQNPNNPEVVLQSVKFYANEEYVCGDLHKGGYDITIKLSQPLIGRSALVKCFNQNQNLIKELVVHFFEKDGLPYFSYEDELRTRVRPFKRNVALVHVSLYNKGAGDGRNSNKIDAVEVVLFDSSDLEIGRMNAIPIMTGYSD